MGGRGTFSKGFMTKYNFRTVGRLYGTKILEGIGGKHGLPEESHSSGSYVRVRDDGTARQLRIYNKDHTARLDIENTVHQGKEGLHAHDYINGVRQPARDLTPEEYRLYSKYFRGN